MRVFGNLCGKFDEIQLTRLKNQAAESEEIQ